MKKFTIGVIGGLGHIGLIQAACLAKQSYHTIALDINAEKMKDVLQGQLPFQESGLPELVKETVANGLLQFTGQIEDLAATDIIFICVGTPSLSNGQADLSQVYQAVEQIARNRSKPCLAVMKSTVPVGTSRSLTEYLKKHHLSGKVTMVSNPEFLREGSGVVDFWQPARIVVGSETPAISEKVAKLYAPPEVPIILTSWENAELIKYASNAFLATKISFINEIALLSAQVGADIRVISKGIGQDPRINPLFLEAGVGFSGPCLEKDLKSLIDQFRQRQQKANILESVLRVNEGQRQGIIDKLQEQLGSLAGKKIGVLGLTFKDKTDDVRDSHSLPIIKHLRSLKTTITVYDPVVKKSSLEEQLADDLPAIEWASSPYEAAAGQDALIILTAWQEYQELDLYQLKNLMKNSLIVDGRNLFHKEDMEKVKITYLGVGI